MTARLIDFCLRRVIARSRLVVVISKKQERQIRVLFPNVPAFFAPITVDSQFWTPEASQPDVLTRYNLEAHRYVLTVGGNDRREKTSLQVAAALGLDYARVTKYESIIKTVKEAEQRLSLIGKAKILQQVSDIDLISLYHYAYMVLLPTVTRTNPAGLSAIVEAMSCGSLVATGRVFGRRLYRSQKDRFDI